MTPKQLWQRYEDHFKACSVCTLSVKCAEGGAMLAAYAAAPRPAVVAYAEKLLRAKLAEGGLFSPEAEEIFPTAPTPPAPNPPCAHNWNTAASPCPFCTTAR